MGGGIRQFFAPINVHYMGFPPLFNTVFWGDLSAHF